MRIFESFAVRGKMAIACFSFSDTSQNGWLYGYFECSKRNIAKKYHSKKMPKIILQKTFSKCLKPLFLFFIHYICQYEFIRK
jgi:hypothetical protein